MPKESLATVTKRRLLGVLFLVVAVGFVSLSIAIYAKVFTTTVDVTLEANHTGNQLLLDSDVKERGIIVGSVKSVKANGSDAIVTLALAPDRVKDIPRNVTAQILPKTLFGEQYVALFIPKQDQIKGIGGAAQNTVPPIKAGDVIPQDRSKGAIEAQDVLGDLIPVLTAVQPAELNSTLTALATALNGRGKELGRTLVNLDKYLKIINPHTDKLVDDLDKLGKVAKEYNGVAPDLFSTLTNLETTVKTVVTRRQALDSLFTTGANTSAVVSSFLANNKQRLIDVTGQTNKVYALLAEYSPEFSCLLTGVNDLANQTISTIYDHEIHLNITVDNTNQGPYKQGEEPKYVTGYGPNCFGLPDNPQPQQNGNFQIPAKYRCLNDGAALTTAPCAQDTSATSATSRNAAIGSSQENALVNAIVAAKLHTTPNKVPAAATVLAAPLLRGHQVVVK
jgi:phospholipid/cholesterol/gamma-HCH transport system substrate-binding protein